MGGAGSSIQFLRSSVHQFISSDHFPNRQGTNSRSARGGDYPRRDKPAIVVIHSPSGVAVLAEGRFGVHAKVGFLGLLAAGVIVPGDSGIAVAIPRRLA